MRSHLFYHASGLLSIPCPDTSSVHRRRLDKETPGAILAMPSRLTGLPQTIAPHMLGDFRLTHLLHRGAKSRRLCLRRLATGADPPA
jgi:hypothetical protein